MQTILHFAVRDDTSGLFSQLARHYDRSKYRMIFATLYPMEPELWRAVEAEGVPCFSFDAKGPRDYLRIALHLARFLRRKNVGILHTHFYFANLVGQVAGFIARTPIRVLNRHHSDSNARLGKRAMFHVKLDQLCTFLSHAVIAVSRDTARHCIEWEKAPPEKVHVVHNGIYLERMQPSSPETLADLRAELGGETHDLIVILARFHVAKGLETLFAALPEIAEKTARPFKVLHAGTGDLAAHYHHLAREMKVENFIEFLGFRRDAADLFAISDLVVVPSISEPFGLVVAEAMLCGAPVVASRVGGIPEIVDDGKDGVLVEPGDVAALVQAVVELLNSPEKRRQFAGAGKQKIIEKFSFEQMLEGYEAIYCELSDKS